MANGARDEWLNVLHDVYERLRITASSLEDIGNAAYVMGLESLSIKLLEQSRNFRDMSESIDTVFEEIQDIIKHNS
jgi:hypothetical protein